MMSVTFPWLCLWLLNQEGALQLASNDFGVRLLDFAPDKKWKRFVQKKMLKKAGKISHFCHIVLHMLWGLLCSLAVTEEISSRYIMSLTFFSHLFHQTKSPFSPVWVAEQILISWGHLYPESVDYLLAWWEASQNAWQSFLLTPLDLSVSVDESNPKV